MKLVARKGRCGLCSVKTTYYDHEEDDRDCDNEGNKKEELSRRIQHRGYRFICKRLHAEVPPVSSVKKHIFCSVCDKFLTDVHQLLFEIEVCKMKLEGKIDDVKERALRVEEAERGSTANPCKRRKSGRGDKRIDVPAESPGVGASVFCNRLASLAKRPLNPTVSLNRVSVPAVTAKVESTSMSSDNSAESLSFSIKRETPEDSVLEHEVSSPSPTQEEDEFYFAISPDSPTTDNIEDHDVDDLNFQSEDNNAAGDSPIISNTMKKDTSSRPLRKSSRLKVLRSAKQDSSSHKLTKVNSKRNKLESLTRAENVEEMVSECESENSSSVMHIDIIDLGIKQNIEDGKNAEEYSGEDPLYMPSDEEIEDSSSDGRASPFQFRTKYSEINKKENTKKN